MNNNVPSKIDLTFSRRGLLGTAGATVAALTGAALPGASAKAEGQASNDSPSTDGPDRPFAWLDGTGPGWQELRLDDFVNVNCHEDTWSSRDGVIYCTGNPIGVIRSKEKYTNFEMSFQWCHRRKGGNSGVFVWTTEESLQQLTEPGLPAGIEVQILDTGYAEVYRKNRPNADTSWFTSHGDVFPVRVSMKPFEPTSPNGTRSFPSEDRVNDHGHWNYYYVRAINGEIRLWVNGKEVSGGNECDPRSGYLCLESEGSPIEFREVRLRKLP